MGLVRRALFPEPLHIDDLAPSQATRMIHPAFSKFNPQ